MKNLAVFYHCLVSGGSLPIHTDFACSIIMEQMNALRCSHLADAASEMIFGVNGDESDLQVVRMFAPPKAVIIAHGAGATTEIPTLNLLRAWLKGHPDWYVLYHHIKGVTHPGNILYAYWRQRMEKACVWGWRNCVSDMDRGVESCGAHWLTPEQFPNMAHSAFWGGTFWWATAKFLLTLPPLPPPTWANRFFAEGWIGSGPRRPRVHDYHPGWP